MRVVSLLPSATETLCLLLGSAALRDGVALVGRSHECDHPPTLSDLPAITRPSTDFASRGSAGVDDAVRRALAEGRSLYTLDEAGLAALSPDLLITQDLCGVCSIDLATVRRIAARLPSKPRVLSLNPRSLEDVLDDVLRVGEAIGARERAEREVAGLRERLDAAGAIVNPFEDGPRVAFLEWTEPIFVGGHWTPELIERAGARHPLNPTRAAAIASSEGNAGAGAGVGVSGGISGGVQIGFGADLAVARGGHDKGDDGDDAASVRDRAERSPLAPGAPPSRRVTPEELAASEPEAIVICPCGVTLEQASAEAKGLLAREWFRALPAAREGRIAVVDGSQMFNRPGPRLVDAFEWLVAWLHDRPGAMPQDFPWERAS